MSAIVWIVVAVVVVPLVAAALAVRLGRRRTQATAPQPAVPDAAPRAIGYTTFPDRRQTVSPESRYEARRVESACEARGMVLHKLIGDVKSYSGPDLERPALVHALAMLEAGEATCLVVTGLDRLSRSAANLGQVVDWVEELGARLVVIDIDLDTDTEQGRLAARALAQVGALEREHELVMPIAVADRISLRRRIAEMRASGMTLQAIADRLNSEGVPTLRGGAEWRPSSVQAAAGYKRPRRREP
jgi:Resolvase, N terminal domain/Recombinase